MAVRSVLSQDCGDFEIILADWVGTHEARQIADSDKRIRYLKTLSSKPYAGWNMAAREARGKYILFLDDDNFLLPYALKFFQGIIKKTAADVITSNHLYYYDSEHPRMYLRNSLGIIPWSGKKSAVDLKQSLKDIFAFKRSARRLRFHTSATIISREVISRSFQNLGFVLLDFLPNMHSLFPILFSFAKSCIFADHPTVIIGRYGNSLSQNWAIMARDRFKKQPFPINLSPVAGQTRINGTLENLLSVRKILPDFYRDIPVDYEQFAKIYIQELAYLDTDFKTLIKNWLDLFRFLQIFPRETKKILTSKALRFATLAPSVYLARRLRLYKLSRKILALLAFSRAIKKTAAQKMAANKEFSIPLKKKYAIGSIDSLAKNIRQILITEIHLDIFNLPDAPPTFSSKSR